MPERPREFLFNPKRDMTGIITGLLLGIIGLSMILPTGLTLVKTGFGIAWFLGSWALGALYDHNTKLLVTVSVLAQIIAIMFYIFSIHAERQDKER